MLQFLQLRENRFHPDFKLRRCDYKPSFNADFLLEKLQCNWEDDHLTIAIGQSEEETLIDEESPVPAFSTKFCSVPTQNHILAMSNEEGEVNIINTNLSGDTSYITCLHAHKNSVFDIGWVPQEMSLVSVSGDQTAALWDVNAEKKLASFRGHNGSVKWVDFRPNDKAVFSTGGRDGCIMIWDSRTTRSSRESDHSPDNIIRGAHSTPMTPVLLGKAKKRVISQPNYNQSITAVLFQDEHTLLSSGATDGIIKAWDIRKHYSSHKHLPCPKYTFPYQGTNIRQGYSSLVFDSSRRLLFANCLDNVIYLFDCCSYQEKAVATYEGHQNRTFYVKAAISSDDRYILSGSSDHCAYIWKVSKPGKPLCQLEGHDAEVTAVAWSPEPEPKLVTCGDDMKFKVWRMWLHEEKSDSASKPNQGKAVMECQSFTDRHRRKTKLTSTKYGSVSTPLKCMTDTKQVFLPSTPELSNHSAVTLTKENDTPVSLSRILKSDQKSRSSICWLSSPSTFQPTKLLPTQHSNSCIVTSTLTKGVDGQVYSGEDRSCFQTPILRNILSPQKNFDNNLRRRSGVSKSLFDEKPVGCQHLCVKENSLLKSPTSNLPNTVDENYPSAPLQQRLTSTRKESNECHSDWLTQLSRQRKRLGGCSPTISAQAKRRISRQSPRRRHKRISKQHNTHQAIEYSPSRAKTLEIFHYFSPTSHK